MVTPEDVTLIQGDWAQVAPISEQAGTLFYERLFSLDPTLRPLFTSDLNEQKRKLMLMLGVVVKGLSDLPKLVPAVQALGRRHVGYGVRDEHYATVGAALLWTLEQGIGANFTAEHAAAWGRAYALLTRTMTAAPQSS